MADTDDAEKLRDVLKQDLTYTYLLRNLAICICFKSDVVVSLLL